MTTKYKQLSEHERFTIELLLEHKNTQTEIAKLLGKSRSTISREIQRNTVNNKYNGERAHNMYLLRREYPNLKD